MKQHISTVKTKITQLVSDRSASQRVAAGGMVFLCLIVISLLFGYEQDAEQYAIWLYYALVVSVVLGLTEDVRVKIWRRVIDFLGKYTFGDNDKPVGENRLYTYIIKSGTWLLLPLPDMMYGGSQPRYNSETKDSETTFMVYISLLTMGIGIYILLASPVLHTQLVQYIIPERYAGGYATWSLLLVQTVSILLWTILWAASLGVIYSTPLICRNSGLEDVGGDSA